MQTREANLYLCTCCHTVQVLDRKMTELDRKLGGFNATCYVCTGGQFFQPILILPTGSKSCPFVFGISDTGCASPQSRPLNRGHTPNRRDG